MSGDANSTNGNDNNGQTSTLPQQGSIDQQLAALNATSLPPSAFFQIPESTKSNTLSTPASKSVSPVGHRSAHPAGRSVSLSGSEEGSPLSVGNASGSLPAAPAGIDHKRKAGVHHPIEEDDEDGRLELHSRFRHRDADPPVETDSDAVTGHEDKRQHQNAKPTKKGGRKSGGGATVEDGTSGKEMSKSARRKEQNRAAQKAFRERREARVTDVRDRWPSSLFVRLINRR